MQLQGSKRAVLSCVECEACSKPFRVFLHEEDKERVFGYRITDWPIGWEENEDDWLELWADGLIYTLCPKCKETKDRNKQIRIVNNKIIYHPKKKRAKK